MAARDQPDQVERYARRTAEMDRNAATQVGRDRAQRAGFDPRELLSEKWLDTVNDLDVDRQLPNEDPLQHNIEEKLGAHRSKQFGIGYISHDEYEEERLKDRGRRRLMNMSYRRRGGTGAKCTGRTRERMTGGEANQSPRMSADLSDQLDAGVEAKRMQRSGSVHGRRFKGTTEVQVVTSNESGPDLDDSGGGLLTRFTGGLLG